MSDTTNSSVLDICADFAEQKLPRWDELPDLELYMDQVLSIVHRHLGGVSGKGLTAAMVNNYVKQGVIPPPVKKKYSRSHLARLIMICLLKASLPISVIQMLMTSELETAPESAIYDRFCGQYERAEAAASSAAARLLDSSDMEAGPLAAIYLSALRAQAEQALSLRLFSVTFPEADKER